MDYNFSDNYEEKNHNVVFIYMMIIMISVICAVMALVFILNKPKSSSKGYQIALSRAESTQKSKLDAKTEQVVKSVEDLVTGSTLTSDQLDIWTLPDVNREQEYNNQKNGTVKNQTTGEVLVEGVKESKDSVEEESVQTTLFSDENEVEKELTEIVIENADGSTQTIPLLENINRSIYDVNNFVYKKPEMRYMIDGKQASTLGAMVSSANTDIDFYKMKRAGCDFVMVRIGQRGYCSGRLVADKSYKDNFENAKKQGLHLGAYFSSQAITKDEVIEEADFVIEVLEDYAITYPVMFRLESNFDEPARIDGLDNESRTKLAISFMKQIEEAGYHAILYGNIEDLLTKYDLEDLQEYDICVAQTNDTPEYPYEFQMWQYDDQGSINGLNEKAALLVNLKEY